MVLWAINARSETPVAYDIDMAQEICDRLPLEEVEGIWLYPDDNVTVLLLNDNHDSHTQLPTYTLKVVETSDARLHPGETIGTLKATSQANIYAIELATERRNGLLLKPVTCMGTLSKEGDSFSFKKQKTPLRGRLNLNFSRLLPGFWKMISTGISSSGTGNSVQLPVGMVKVYPGYDGNGSSRRKIRYL